MKKSTENKQKEVSENMSNDADSEKEKFIAYRREGRVIAFQTLFSYEFEKRSITELLRFKWLDETVGKEARLYATGLVEGTLNKIEEIDDIIKGKLINWDFGRVSIIEKSILRFSIYSLFFEKKVPERVVINEAVEIAKQFGTDDSYKFVNGILDAVKKAKQKENT